MRLGDILQRDAILDDDQIFAARRLQDRYGGRIGSAFIQLGYVDVDSLSRALAKQHNVLPVLRKHLGNIDVAAVKLLRADLAEHYCAIPLGYTAKPPKRLIVAFRDPTLNIIEEVGFATGHRVEPAVAPEFLLFKLLQHYYNIQHAVGNVYVKGALALLSDDIALAPRAGGGTVRPPPPDGRSPTVRPPAPAAPAVDATPPKRVPQLPQPRKRPVPVAPPPVAYAAHTPQPPAAYAPPTQRPPPPTLHPPPPPSTRMGYTPTPPSTRMGYTPPPPSTRMPLPPPLPARAAQSLSSHPPPPSTRMPPPLSPSPQPAKPPPPPPPSTRFPARAALGPPPPPPPPPLARAALTPPPPPVVRASNAAAPPRRRTSGAMRLAIPRGTAPAGPAPSAPVVEEASNAVRPALSLSDALLKVANARTNGAIGDAVIDYLRSTYGCGVVFILRNGVARGWKGFTEPPGDVSIESIAIPLDTPSMLSHVHERQLLFRGRPPAEGIVTDTSIWQWLMTLPPQEVIVAPIILNEHVTHLVYAHAPDGGLIPVRVGAEMSNLCAMAGETAARLLREG